jgi:lipoprotein-anchoring transpeptidase ErfK/SrfK
MPRPGTYSVFSRSTRAYSGSVHMDWMVRFARGRSLAIGFHAIPVGRRGPIQSLAELGQFRSHGCVRQSPADARRMWDFAPLGTKVVVTA